MRILHTIHSMSPETGGPAEGLRRLAYAALTAGLYSTEVLSLDAPGKPYLASETLPIHAVGPGLGKYGYTPRLDHWLRENLSRFDGVVVNGLWQYHTLAVWKACRGRMPYVVFTHGMLDPWFKQAYPLKHLKKAIYWNAVEHRVLRDATGVMFTAALEAELAKKTFRRNKWTSVVVPYGTLEPSGDRDLQIEEFFKVCPEVRGRDFVLFLARLHEKKGCDLLIDAFARSSAAHPEKHLVLAGPDRDGWKSRLLALASSRGVGDRVHFPGMLQGGAKWGAFYAATVFALPSHQENFGIAVAEALACGTPVLISNKVNIWREVVEEGVGLVDDDDLDGTCRLLEGWYRLPLAEHARMVERCRPAFERRFNLRRLPERIAGIFAREHAMI